MEELYPDDQATGINWRVASLILVIFVSSTFTPLSSAVEIHAVSFQLPPPPYLSGSLESNALLAEAERRHEGRLSAPQAYVRYKEEIYAVTASGTVVNVAPCRPVVIADLSPRTCNGVQECGHLVSIRLSASDMLLVLDAYRGVFQVHPITGVTRHLYNSQTVVNGRPSLYLSDMLEMPDGTIVISDASATFDYANRFWIRFEGRADGRLLGFNPSNGQVKEIMAGLAYPSGLELTTNKRAFLLAEATRSRIYRVELDKDRLFRKSYFHENLPGMPEHIRQTNKGSYWVGLTFPRYQGDVSVLDQYSTRPAARNFLAQRRSEQQLKMMYNTRGLAVELSTDGQIIRSMHDPTSSKVREVTEVNEQDGLAYIGTRGQNAMVRVMTSASRLTLDSMIQVMRSRCKVTEDKIPEAKEALRRRVLSRKTAPTASNTAITQASDTAVFGQTQPVQAAPSPTTREAQNQQPITQQYSTASSSGRSSSVQPEALSSKSIRQGLSRIQKLLSRSGVQAAGSTSRSTPSLQQLPNPPKQQVPPQTPVAVQQRSWAPKQTPQRQQVPTQRRPSGQASLPREYFPQPPQQTPFSQTNKNTFLKPPVVPIVTQQKINPATFSASNKAAVQSPPMPGFPPINKPVTNDKIYQNRIRQPHLPNAPMPPYVPMSSGQYGTPRGATEQVYAPNGNVPRPFSATDYQNNFAQANPPQSIPVPPNTRQHHSQYTNSFRPKPNYRPPARNVPADPNSPFLPHGLVPTGHHMGVQSARQEAGNEPQIVHKVVNGQLITQIIVPDVDALTGERRDTPTTIAPLRFLPTESPIAFKKEIVKPERPPQDEKQKKLALGGFLGIAQKTNREVMKPPAFDLGPDMVNTLPEYGQIPAAALNAAPIAIYGFDLTTRPPTKAESNAALALSMFTGVSEPAKSTNQQQQQTQQAASVISPAQQPYVPLTQFTGQTLNSVAAQELPSDTVRSADKTQAMNKAANIQMMQMFHPGDHNTQNEAPMNSATNAEAKTEFGERKQSLLKQGLQQLHQLVRTTQPTSLTSHRNPVPFTTAPTNPASYEHSLAQQQQPGTSHQPQPINGPQGGRTHSTVASPNGRDFLSGIVGSPTAPHSPQSPSHQGLATLQTTNESPVTPSQTTQDISSFPAIDAGPMASQTQHETHPFGTSAASPVPSNQRQDLTSAPNLGGSPLTSFSGAATIHPSQQENESRVKGGAVSESSSMYSRLAERVSPTQSGPAAATASQFIQSQNNQSHSPVPQKPSPHHDTTGIHSYTQNMPPRQTIIQTGPPLQSQPNTTTQNTFEDRNQQPTPQAQQLRPNFSTNLSNSQGQELPPNLSTNRNSVNAQPPPLSPPLSHGRSDAPQPSGSHGFIQIYKGPGEYVIIPLSKSILETLSTVQFGGSSGGTKVTATKQQPPAAGQVSQGSGNTALGPQFSGNPGSPHIGQSKSLFDNVARSGPIHHQPSPPPMQHTQSGTMHKQPSPPPMQHTQSGTMHKQPSPPPMQHMQSGPVHHQPLAPPMQHTQSGPVHHQPLAPPMQHMQRPSEAISPAERETNQQIPHGTYFTPGAQQPQAEAANNIPTHAITQGSANQGSSNQGPSNQEPANQGPASFLEGLTGQSSQSQATQTV